METPVQAALLKYVNPVTPQGLIPVIKQSVGAQIPPVEGLRHTSVINRFEVDVAKAAPNATMNTSIDKNNDIFFITVFVYVIGLLFLRFSAVPLLPISISLHQELIG